MNTFYFNTGVKAITIPEFPYEYHKEKGNVIRNGVLMIPFECEAPETAILMFLCDDPNLEQSKYANVQVYPVYNTNMISKYAYFKINQ